MLKSILSNEKFVVIHSSLKKFNNTKMFINEFINDIKNYPNTTFLFPHFNYDFLKTGVYEFETSESQVGQLCNIVKNNFEYIKSNSPVFSFIIIGPNKELFLNCDDSNCFGHNSLFDLLIQNKKNVLYIHLNCLSFTQIHYWEQLFSVPYRYNKEFIGKYIKNNIISQYILNYNVRDLNLNPESIGQTVNEQFFKLTNYKIVKYMDGEIYFNNLDEIDNHIINLLQNDLYALILNKDDTNNLSERDVFLCPNIFTNSDYYNTLLEEIKQIGKNDIFKLWHGDTHYIVDDHINWKKLCPKFIEVIDTIKEYFGLDVKATRFNWYENSNHFKPYHFDAAAFDEEKAKFQNITIGVSFGATRDIAFEHAVSKNTISFPLIDKMIYGFSKQVNIDWRHGIPQIHPDNFSNQGRISIIIWGYKKLI